MPLNEWAVSVAMCTFDGSLYIREQLQSIARQTLRPRELVVCDDQSSDDTVRIVEEFAATSPFRVRLHVNERRLGLNKNYERVISLCEGDLIALSDQDDVWYADKLEKSVHALLARPESLMVSTNADAVDSALTPLGYRTWEAYGLGGRERRMFDRHPFEFLLHKRFIAGAATVFRSEIRGLVLPIPADCQYNHDGWISLLVSACSDVALLDEPLMAWRRHPGQWTDPGNLPIIATPSTIRELNKQKVRLRGHVGDDKLFQELLARLAVRAQTYPRADRAQRLLEDILGHNGARRLLPKQRYKRIPRIARELATLRYWRFSNGIRSAVRDLITERET